MSNISRVAFICPGSLFAKQPQEKAHACQDYLQQHFQLDSEYNHSVYTKLTAKEKAQVLIDYCLRDDIDLIWALRGGEGSADLIPYLEERKEIIASAKPKILLGFSDITALLVYFYQQFNWPTIHGPSCSQFVRSLVDDLTISATKELLLKNHYTKIDSLVSMNELAKQANTLEAQLIGGCLSLLIISIKDAWEIDTENKIVFIEDINEKPYVILRSLKYLQRIGKFDQIKALIIGDLLGADATQLEHESMDYAIKKFAANCHFPVLTTHQFGHGRTNLPLSYHQPVQLRTGQSPSLIFT